MVKSISLEEAESLLHYEPDTGEFYWLVDRGRGGGGAKAGSFAGKTSNRGYILIGIAGQNFLAHRLAWLFVHGFMPNDEIDHRNGNRADNRIKNLRLATRVQNARNTQKSANNTTGFKGVSRRRGKFKATIYLGRQVHLGDFATAEEAHAAYCKAAQEHYGEFMRAA